MTTFQQSVLASLCDASHAASMQAMATKIGQLSGPPCFTSTIQNNGKGEPMGGALLNSSRRTGGPKTLLGRLDARTGKIVGATFRSEEC